MMEHSITFQNSKNNKLAGILSVPTDDVNKSIIIFVHGFSSDKNTKNFLRLKEIFDKNNIASFRFDIYGHGESDGNFEDITVSEAVDDVLSAVRYIHEKGYQNIGLVGSSFGGLASIIAASKIHNLFCLVLKSAVSNYEDLYKQVKTEDFMKKWQ